MKKKNILKYREAYKPFEYLKAYQFMKMQQAAHWLPGEVPMAKDIHDWEHELTKSEKMVVGQILKSFAQTETYVGDYWADKVATWFPKHEIHDMAVTFAAQEAIHTEGYDFLNEELGLLDYEGFLEDPTTMAKLNRLKEIKGSSVRDKARSLAIFSAFTEGVSLYSSFAVLFNFSKFQLLDGVETIVSWSILDEQLHSIAGCWLFNELIKEHPEIWDDELKKDIYEAARVTVQLEDDFIDNAFSLGKIRGINKEQLKAFIRNRCNQKLVEIGLKPNWKNIDKTLLKKMDWFDQAHSGVAMTDFFAKKVTDYQKSYFNIGNLFKNHANKTKFKNLLNKIHEKEEAEKSEDEYTRELKEHKKKDNAPEWMTPQSYQILSKGYRVKGETPDDMYRRVCHAASKELFSQTNKRKIRGFSQSELEDKFYDYIRNKAWMCPASPIIANLGTDRGLPISCYGINVDDNLRSIHEAVSELGAMTAGSGGVGIDVDDIRGADEKIQGGKRGRSGGVVPWIKTYDSTVIGVNQGNRKGAISATIRVDHKDFYAFMKIRKPQGDVNTQCLNSNHCVVINNDFLRRVDEGDYEARKKWTLIMKTRQETNEPYLMNEDNVNDMSPEAYIKNNLLVKSTNICTEITLYADSFHSYICCLLSHNLTKYDEYKDSDLPEISVLFLNGVLNEFIRKTGELEANGDFRLAKARRSAVKGRAIGIGALGWHSFLQSKGIKFESFEAMTLNNEIFKNMSIKAKQATRDLIDDEVFPEPEWCKGTGVYNTHVLALAPTRTNASIVNAESFSVEPLMGNAFVDKGAKGSFFIKNSHLEKLLKSYGKDDDKTWKSIDENNGSVSHLDFLTDDEKGVFKTAFEIDQNVIVNQAAQRQKYICQSQSINLFFAEDVDPEFFNSVHFEGMKQLKTLYYCRTQIGLKTKMNFDKNDGCASCEG